MAEKYNALVPKVVGRRESEERFRTSLETGTDFYIIFLFNDVAHSKIRFFLRPDFYHMRPFMNL